MLRHSLFACGLAAVASIALAACGSDSSSGPATPAAGGSAGSSGGSAGTQNTCADCIHAPDPSPSATEGDGAGQVFAIKTLDLGEAGTDHWKTLGYDLDDKKSAANAADHCKLFDPSANYIKTDGNNGIDNAFGAHILSALPSETEAQVHDGLLKGTFTLLIQVDKIGSKTDYVKLPAALYAGAARTGSDPDAGAIAPAWDGNDEWPVFCELMTDCQASGTKQRPDNTSLVAFPNSYVAGGRWVSGPRGEGTITLALSVAGYSLDLTVHKAVISAKLGSETPVPTTATEGIVAGILKTDEVVKSLQNVAGRVSSDFCGGDTLQNFVDQVKKASDILIDGTQDATKNCDGISIGLGFTAGAAKIGKVLDKAPQGDDPCADAGTK